TGPKAWNEWISNLVQELFFKILHILETGELANPDVSRKVKETMTRVLRAIPPGMDRKELALHLDAMSPRYLLNTPPNTMVHHLQLVQRFQKALQDEDMGGFILETREESNGFWEIIFMAKDRPGLFSDITGVLALHNINILSADIYTWRDSTAVDIFRVTSPLDPIHPHETWERVQRDLKNTLDGTLSLPDHLNKKASPSIFFKKIKHSRPPKLLVDNTSSDFFTLIEVFAGDRVGLLYTITRTLFDLRLDIRIAKVATKGDLVADVFYVRDLEGQKVEDKERAEEIKTTLLHHLAME
ncbi:MAG: ACT domain-containing protein, partial [Pseudomonadota bacterium]